MRTYEPKPNSFNKSLVSLRLRNSQKRVPRNDANFGIGTLVRNVCKTHAADACANFAIKGHESIYSAGSIAGRIEEPHLSPSPC